MIPRPGRYIPVFVKLMVDGQERSQGGREVSNPPPPPTFA